MYACVPGRTLKSSDGAKRAFSEKTSQLPAHVWTVAPTFRVPGCLLCSRSAAPPCFLLILLASPDKIRGAFLVPLYSDEGGELTVHIQVEPAGAKCKTKHKTSVVGKVDNVFWTPFDKHV